MTPTAKATPEPIAKASPRSKAQQIVDILSNCTPNQVRELAGTWLDSEQETLSIFERELKHIRSGPESK